MNQGDLKTDNLFHRLPPGPNPPEKIYCVVEIPRGGTNKYEYDKNLGVFKLDRTLYSSVFYPTKYGFIPQTWAQDNDPLDIMVVCTFSTFPGCLLETRPVGVLLMNDSGYLDEKIIAVAANDPRFKNVVSLNDLSSHFKKEVQNFWESYVTLQPGKEISIKGWGGRDKAKVIIEKAIKDYSQNFAE